jgi:poly(3-hydroxybutyrate) depolymerase
MTLIAHITRQGVDAIVIEIADGIFQRETAALLRSGVFARLAGGIVLAARDSMGASAGAEALRAASTPVLALSGLLSASPLQCAEARAATGLPVHTRQGLATAGTAMEIIRQAQRRPAHHSPPERVAQVETSVMVWSLPRGRVLRRVLQVDPSQEYVVYIPTSGASGAPIFVAVHGLASKPTELARVFAELCEANRVVMVAPVFATDRHADYQRLGRAGRGVRADLTLERCVAEVASLTTTDARQIHLFGYSGGAQFAHRYLMAHPHRVARAVIAAAGWYTFPDTRQRFPYGIRRHRSLPEVNFDPQEFLRVPVTVLVGEADVGMAKVRSTARCNAQQGLNRLERARNWTAAMRTAAQAYGYEPCVSCIEVPQIGHSFATFCERGALAQRVFAALFDVSVPTTSGTEAAAARDVAQEQVLGHG